MEVPVAALLNRMVKQGISLKGLAMEDTRFIRTFTGRGQAYTRRDKELGYTIHFESARFAREMVVQYRPRRKVLRKSILRIRTYQDY